jgi:trans-aconitate methyltransferase
MKYADKTPLPNSKEWFDSVGDEGLRGLIGEPAYLHYAAYILDSIKPKEGCTVIDLGCGDGAVVQAMSVLRPDLKLEGWDFSEKQIEKARRTAGERGHLAFSVVDLKSVISQSTQADCFFSFSVIQYFSVQEFSALNEKLTSQLKPGGTISHLSIPDLAKRALLFQSDWLDRSDRSPIASALHVMKMLAVDAKRRLFGDRSYGTSLFHDPSELACCVPGSMSAEIRRPSDSWYRFDIHLR